MASYKDAKGREWVFDLDAPLIDMVYAEKGVSLYEVIDDGMKGLSELVNNRPLFLEVMYLLLRDQCKAQGIDETEWLRGIKGDVWDEMPEAFYLSLADFFPKKKRELMKSLMQEAKPLTNDLFDKASGKAMKLLHQQFGKWSESLDSIPEDSNSGNLSSPLKEGSDTIGSSSPA